MTNDELPNISGEIQWQRCHLNLDRLMFFICTFSLTMYLIEYKKNFSVLQFSG